MAGGRDPGGAVAGAEWLTPAQVARLYGVTPGRVRQMIHEGQVAAERNGRHWRVSRRWLDAQHAASGGVLPAADGRGLPGFLGTLAAADEDAFWGRMRQETQRAVMEAVGVFAQASVLERLVEDSLKRFEAQAARRRTG